MKHCPQWQEAIAACALGDPPEPDFAAHLAICPQCENALRDSRAMAARIDDALRRRAAVAPPVYGPQRVMSRIRAQAPQRRWWSWAAAIATVLIAIVIWVRRPAPAVAELSTWRSPTEALLRPPLATPRLGEGFFKLKPSGEIYAK
jgi:anti-sigma factor RsiW